MKKIIVTGCNGQLGRAVNQQYAGSTEYELVNTDVAELDITKVDEVLKLAREVKPCAIINCAAYTNVDKCETEPDLAYKINAVGARNLAIAASDVGAKLMHISTDYVFPGDVAERPLTEFDTPSPKSMYGATKLAGENFVRDFADRYFIIRTAWLYGDGHNFAKTMLKLSETNDTIGVVMDQVGTPTSAVELAKAIKYLLPRIITDSSTAPAREIQLGGVRCHSSASGRKKTVIEPITSQEYKRRFPASADRPAYSILENYMLKLTTDFSFASWQDAIEVYMKELLG